MQLRTQIQVTHVCSPAADGHIRVATLLVYQNNYIPSLLTGTGAESGAHPSQKMEGLVQMLYWTRYIMLMKAAQKRPAVSHVRLCNFNECG